MLKEIIIAIDSYFKAHRFITKHRLWKWIILPGLLYALLFSGGMYLFIKSANSAITHFSSMIGLPGWVQQQKSNLLSFLFVMGGFMIQLLMLLFYFSLFKYLILIIGSPLFAYLSEKTEAIIDGKEYTLSSAQLLRDCFRSILLALRNTVWQTVYIVSLLLISFIPLVGWIIPVFLVLIECYYYGFSMLDYSCGRHQLSSHETVVFIGKHRGLAIGNGLMFFLMHLLPVIGWVLAPAYAIVAATISIYYQQKDI